MNKCQILKRGTHRLLGMAEAFTPLGKIQFFKILLERHKWHTRASIRRHHDLCAAEGPTCLRGWVTFRKHHLLAGFCWSVPRDGQVLALLEPVFLLRTALHSANVVTTRNNHELKERPSLLLMPSMSPYHPPRHCHHFTAKSWKEATILPLLQPMSIF